MKNYISIAVLFYSLLILSCSDDDEIRVPNPAAGIAMTELLEINVDDRYFNSLSIKTNIIAITNAENDLFILDTIRNGDNKVYEIGAPIESYNLTLFTEFEFEEYTSEVVNDIQTLTYLGLTPGQKFTFREGENNGGPKVKVRVDNCPSRICYATNSTNTSGWWGGVNSNNFRVIMNNIGENLFILLGNDNELTEKRYIWRENLASDLEFSIEYDELPIAEKKVFFEYPNAVSATHSAIYGLSDDDRQRYSLQCMTINNEFKGFAYPENIFDEFLVVHTTKVDEDLRVKVQKRSKEIEEEYVLPSLSFEINDPSLSEIEITSNERYDIWTASYAVLRQDSVGHKMRWSVSGSFEELVRIDVQNLFSEITSGLSTDYLGHFDDYIRVQTEIFKFSLGKNINEFVKDEYDYKNKVLNPEEIHLFLNER